MSLMVDMMNSSSSKAQAQNFHLPKINKNDPMGGAMFTPRTMSRASSFGDLTDRKFRSYAFKQPIDADVENFTQSKTTSKKHTYSNDLESKMPDQVKAVYSNDPNKISMPIFGSRPGSTASLDVPVSRAGSITTNQRVDIEDYYNLLKDKLSYNTYEIKTKFRNADQEGRGGVSKEALAHIVASILGPNKPLSHQHFLKLLDRLSLRDRTYFKFEEFYNCFQEKNQPSDWIDPVRSNNSFKLPVTRKATQVFVILKEKARLRTDEMVRLVPYLNGGTVNKVFKMELLNVINGMGIKMETDEFEKLWKKFDLENTGIVNADLFLKRLGLLVDDSSSSSFNNNSSSDFFKSDNSSGNLNVPMPNLNDKLANSTNTYKVKQRSKKAKNPIQNWLKKRFRDGFSKMKSSFEELDLQKTGYVRRDQFLNVLRQHNFNLESNLLDAFLERCGIKLEKNSALVSYRHFLDKFQNRSDQGLAYRLILNGDIASESEDRAVSTIGRLERRMVNMFQNDFLGLLQTFRRIDRNKTNKISKQEFRAAIESHFSIELTDAEFADFLRDVPRDAITDQIEYLEFMTKFDSDSTSTLFDSQSYKDEDFQPRSNKRREYEPIYEENENTPAIPKMNPNYNGRSLDELHHVIKEKIKNDYKKVETAWSEVDKSNSNEMNKEMMYELLRRVKMTPAINRDEIDLLWSQFILKDNKKLEYWQFVRHFGYSKKSAAYQNAKISPPKKGDNDMMLTSNKLGRDSILIRGSVQSKLIIQFDNLKRCFQEIDPYMTNLLLRDEFEEILRELCPELNNQEMEFICSKYENKSDGRINYLEFLAPYAPKKMRQKPPSNLDQSSDLPSSRIDMNDSLIIKMRLKLSEQYKELRRLFKQHDYKQTGLVPISAFKEVIGSKMKLTEDDMYDLMRKLDREVTGMINYNKFINEILKPQN